MDPTIETINITDNITAYGSVNYIGSTITGLFLMTSLICDLLLMYITIRHGFGSKLLDILVFNWAIFNGIYGITSIGMHIIYQFMNNHGWGLGLPMCHANLFLTNFCLIPIDILPPLICLVLFLEVFPNKAGILGKLLGVRPMVWITLGVWIWAGDCVFGSFYQGIFMELGRGNDYCFFDSKVEILYPIEFIFEYLVGAVFPFVFIIIIGALTVRNTKETGGKVLSPLSDKLKVRQLILAIMGILIIHYVFYTVTFFLISTSGLGNNFLLRGSIIVIISISLALLCCHLEFQRSLRRKKMGVSDETPVLYNVHATDIDMQPTITN